MSGEPKDLRAAQAQTKVVLDGRVVNIPAQHRTSATAVRDYLESLAMHQERVLSSLTIDGTLVDLRSKRIDISAFSEVHAESNSFFEMGRELIARSRKQIGDLIGFVESISMQIVINDWQKIESAWSHWIAEFKSPLIAIKFAKDLCGHRIDELMIGETSFGVHNREFGSLLHRLEEIFTEKNPVGLSDFLDRSYLPWLRGLANYMDLLNAD